MDTRFLESFLVVSDVGSISEAARRLRLTPAAIAQRIHALEVELGHPLLTRSGRTVRPTSAGASIVEHARQILRDTRRLAAIAGADQPSGDLRLGAIPSAVVGILPPGLKRMTQTHPGIDVRLTIGNSADLYGEVVAGNLDAALITRQFKAPKSLEWLELRRETILAIAPEEMKIDDISEALGRTRFIRYDRTRWGGKLADQYLRSNRIDVKDWIELESLEAIWALVHHGLGMSLVPDSRPPWERGFRIKKFALPGPTSARSVGLLWNRTSPYASLAKRLADEIARDAS